MVKYGPSAKPRAASAAPCSKSMAASAFFQVYLSTDPWYSYQFDVPWAEKKEDVMPPKRMVD